MPAELLINSTDGQSLDGFVASLPSLIGCDRWEQRESSNYVEGRYYRCVVFGVEITAAIADDAEFKEWHLRLHFKPHEMLVDDKRCLDGLAECVARTLVLHSYDVIRPNDIVRPGGGAIRYELNRAEGVTLRDRIRTVAI